MLTAFVQHPAASSSAWAQPAAKGPRARCESLMFLLINAACAGHFGSRRLLLHKRLATVTVRTPYALSLCKRERLVLLATLTLLSAAASYLSLWLVCLAGPLTTALVIVQPTTTTPRDAERFQTPNVHRAIRNTRSHLRNTYRAPWGTLTVGRLLNHPLGWSRPSVVLGLLINPADSVGGCSGKLYPSSL